MLPTVDVIIPFFNGEKYMKRCLDSILNQTYKNYRVILINDGSTDKSGQIALSYISRYPKKFINIQHDKKLGVSQSRNDGIKISNSKYLTFIDVDDFVRRDHLYQLVTAKLINPKNVSCVKAKRVYDITEENIICKKTNYEFYDNIYDILRQTIGFKDIQGYTCNKLFDTGLIKDKNLFFDNKISVCEDLVFVCQYLLKTNSGYNLAKTASYQYFVNENSAVSNMNKSNEQIQKKCTNELYAYSVLKKILADYGFSDFYFLQQKITWVVNNTINEYISRCMFKEALILFEKYKVYYKKNTLKIILGDFVPLKARASFFIKLINNVLRLSKYGKN